MRQYLGLNMFCTSCGTENPDDLRFCIECGFALSLVPPADPQEVPVYEPSVLKTPPESNWQPYHESSAMQPPPTAHEEPIQESSTLHPPSEPTWAYHEPTVLQPPTELHAPAYHEPTLLQPPPAPHLDPYHEPTMLHLPPAAPNPAVKTPPPASTPKSPKAPTYFHHAGERVGVYTLEEPMGVGAFAEVWKALETTANRSVALKIFYDRVMINPDQAKVFRLEAQKQAQLEHERVTPIYYCHLDPEHGGLPCYIAMKLMPGGTLKDVLQEKKRIPPQEALTIILDVLEGLDAAHATGIIHRDIKPRNVLFDKHGRATLADFGIAKDLKVASQTVAGTVMGTPTYMSPEQSLGMTITQASDIYSVGIMLYEMLAGEPPYTGKSVMEILIAHQKGNPPKLSQAVPGISPEIERIVFTCLERDAERRYSDCKSLIQEVDAIREPAAVGAGGAGIKSPRSITGRFPAPVPPPSTMPRETNPNAPSGGPSESKIGRNIAILILVLGLLAIVAWWLVSRR